MEPSLAFQTAVRSALVSQNSVTDLVEADRIRAGSTRPDRLPSIILANPQMVHIGRDASGAYLTRCYIDLHVWAIEDGADQCRQIAAAVSHALWDAPIGTEAQSIDDYVRPSFIFMRDPDPQLAYCHGVGTVEGVIQWTV